MRNLTFLLSFLLFATTAAAYTVVLQNGRRCTGELISDAGATVQIRDAATGAVLSVRKDQVNAEATLAANAPRAEDTPADASPEAQSPRSLAALAGEWRKQRTGRARAYTADDLKSAPELSVSGTPESDAESRRVSQPAADTLDERRWRSDARAARRELETAQDRAATAARACDQARKRNQSALGSSHRHPLELAPLTQEPSECRRFAELNERLAQARDRFDAFQERARRAGVPWQWLE